MFHIFLGNYTINIWHPYYISGYLPFQEVIAHVMK